jgi:hypothetical protein
VCAALGIIPVICEEFPELLAMRASQAPEFRHAGEVTGGTSIAT